MSGSDEGGFGEGFMEFAEGWNQSVKGWYHEAAGTVEKAYGYATGDDETMIGGAVEAGEGEEQAERGYNLMGAGVSEMLGLVEHGHPDTGAPEPPADSGGGYDSGDAGPDADESYDY
jgi:uncharacterized protein YjbJ (UPF0337 family)